MPSNTIIYRIVHPMLTKMNGNRALIDVLVTKRLNVAEQRALVDFREETDALMEGCEILSSECGFRHESACEADGCEILRSGCGFRE